MKAKDISFYPTSASGHSLVNIVCQCGCNVLRHSVTGEEAFKHQVDLNGDKAGFDLICRDCAEAGRHGKWHVRPNTTHAHITEVEDVYDVSHKDDGYVADYLGNNWGKVFVNLRKHANDEQAVRREFARYANPVLTFTERYGTNATEPLDVYLYQHMKCHHPQKIVRLDRLALMVSGFRDLAHLKRIYNEVHQIINGKGFKGGLPFPESEFNPDLLEMV